MFGDNPVVKYVFNLSDISHIAINLDRSATGVADIVNTLKVAGQECAPLPGIGPEVASACASISSKLVAAEHGMRTDARWLAGVVTRLARDEAMVWTAGTVRSGLRFAKTERALKRDLAKLGRMDRRGSKALRTFQAAVDIFGPEVTGSKLPKTALAYYKTATRFKAIDRMINSRIRVPVAWYGMAATDALRNARNKATGPLRRMLDKRLGDQYDKARKGMADSKLRWAEKFAGDGRGFGRVRRIGQGFVPLMSAPGLYFDGRELMTQRHGYGLRGGLEVFRDTTAVMASGLHLGSDVAEVVPVAGTVVDKGLDVVAGGMDIGVMAMDGVDWVAFEHGDDVVHGVGAGANWTKNAAGDAVGAIGGLFK